MKLLLQLKLNFMKREIFFTKLFWGVLLSLFLTAACSKEGGDPNTDDPNTQEPPVTPPPAGSFTDSRDQNIYKTVKIGEQLWMAENLRYLPQVFATDQYGLSASEPRYYVSGYYRGSSVEEAKEKESYNKYGVIYNWPAAMGGAEQSNSNPSGVQGACPQGWHLPSLSEWEELLRYLNDNGYNYDGSIGGELGEKLAKALAAPYDLLSNFSIPGVINISDGAPLEDSYPQYQNRSGFNIIPADFVNASNGQINLQTNSYFYSATIGESGNPYRMYIYFTNNNAGFSESANKGLGISVRCVKD